MSQSKLATALYCYRHMGYLIKIMVRKDIVYETGYLSWRNKLSKLFFHQTRIICISTEQNLSVNLCSHGGVK